MLRSSPWPECSSRHPFILEDNLIHHFHVLTQSSLLAQPLTAELRLRGPSRDAASGCGEGLPALAHGTQGHAQNRLQGGPEGCSPLPCRLAQL